MNNNIFRLSIIQTQIKWEDKAANLRHFNALLRELSGQTHLAVLPEMFTTGFSMQSQSLSETTDGTTMTALKAWSSTYQMAIAGSFMAVEGDRHYNRAFFVTPCGDASYCDKRHLFRMNGEHRYFEAGKERLTVPYRGWNICTQICYDLRFPVWSRNVNNAYDLLIYAANWPASRKNVWRTLLPARAMENMAYVCGVNTVGTDGKGSVYEGGSMICSPKGNKLVHAGNCETVRTCILKKDELNAFRAKFPAWEDADSFVIK
jgi:predicted amidohydrolase